MPGARRLPHAITALVVARIECAKRITAINLRYRTPGGTKAPKTGSQYNKYYHILALALILQSLQTLRLGCLVHRKQHGTNRVAS